MGLDLITLAAAKGYVADTADSLGSIKGAPCTIKSQTETDDSYIVTFEWTGTSGAKETSQLTIKKPKDGIDGLPGKNGKDGQPGKDGSNGIGISKIEKIGTVDLVDTYRITFTDNSTFDYEVKNGKDGQGGSGGTVDVPIEKIKVNGELQTPVNKVVDITVPEAYDDTEIRAELANKADTDHTHTTVNGHTVESDVPVDAKFTDTVYDDTQVKTAIQAVANGLMDSVGYSADYKTIDIIAKNGVKKSVNVAPIISHASITELSDVDTTNKATGKALVYNATTSKHEYADVSGTDEKVKMDASTDAKYLGELLDNITIANENGELKVKKLDGQEVTITEINYLKGLTMNVMDLVNMFSNGGVKIINTPVATYAELLTLDKSSFIEGISYLVYVLADENHDNAKTTYLVDKGSETPTYFGFADSQRDFTTNPIDLATEITGKLGISNMDSDAIKALFTVDDTYKTETATNNAFSTHGAKALYDELLLAIGNKANASDLTDHKDDTDIHVSTEDRTKWDSAKTHADSAHAPSNAQENVLETVKVNNQEITPDENKAVNIDLTGYAEHDEIVGENLIPYPYAQPERTTNGITFTFADDGSVIANGTATENADFSVCVRTNFGTDKALMLKPGIYAITGCPEGGSDSTYRIQVQFGDKTELKYNLKADYGKGFVFEVTEEYAKYACQIQCHVQKGYTVTDLVFKPMLVLGSVLKEYQPYKLSRESLRKDINAGVELASRVDNQFSTATGNNITVNDSVDGNIIELGIKGNSFQKTYGGKNLYNPTLETNELNGITCTQNVDANGNPDGTYTINGTSTKDRWISFGYTTLNPGKYKFIATENNVEINNLCVSSKQTSIAIPGNIFTIQSKSVCDIGLSTYNNKTFNNVLIKPMITTDLSATYDDFEPYVGGIPSPNPSYPQAINSVGDDGSLVVKSCGKNLIPFPYNDGVRTNVGLTTTPLSNGMVSVSGTNTGKGALFNFNYPTNASSLIKLDPSKTYAFFNPLKTDANNQIVLGVRWYLEGQELSTLTGTNTNIIYNGDSNGAIIKSGFSYVYVYLYAYDSGKTFNNVLFAPMLVEVNEDGTYPTDYEIYKSSTSTIPLSEPLRAIGDVKDEITHQDGKWGVLRRIKRINANDLTWHAYSDYVFGDGFTSDILPKSGTKAYCNIAKINYPMTNDWAEFCFTGITSTSDCHLNVRDTTTFPTITEWNTYIASNDVYFDYPLANPTFEPFIDQTLPYLSTYDGVTNISNDDALSAEMTVKYPTTDVSGVGSRNESRIAELAKDTDDKFDEVNESLSVIGKCKNLLNPTLQTTTQNGVTCTNNGDGTYTLNGTATSSNAGFNLIGNEGGNSVWLTMPADGKIIFAKGDVSSKIACAAFKSEDGATMWAEGIIPKGTNIRNIYIAVWENQTLNNVIIKPMLTTDLSATYDDFVPYTGDGETLTHDVAEIKNDLGGLTFSASGTTLTITDGTNTWTLGANS